MNSENILLDKVKEICSIESDNALAIKLGIQRQAISKIRREEMHLSDERIAELCEMANLDGGKWAANIKSEKAESPKERAMWKSIVKRLSASTTTLLISASMTCPNPSQAQSIDRNFSNESSHNAYYVHQVGAYKARCLASPKNGV